MAQKIFGGPKNSTSYKKSPDFKPKKVANPSAEGWAKDKVIGVPTKESYRKGVTKRGGKDTITPAGKAIDINTKDTGLGDL